MSGNSIVRRIKIFPTQGNSIEITIEDARKLYEELHELFGEKKASPSPFPPMPPVIPPKDSSPPKQPWEDWNPWVPSKQYPWTQPAEDAKTTVRFGDIDPPTNKGE